VCREQSVGGRAEAIRRAVCRCGTTKGEGEGESVNADSGVEGRERSSAAVDRSVVGGVGRGLGRHGRWQYS
jgi:hypothetical protein